MTIADVLEWMWTLTTLVGVSFMWSIMRELNEYRTAAKMPHHQNGRRGYLASVLLRLGVVCFGVQFLTFISGVIALTQPNLAETNVTAGVIAIATSVAIDLGWFYTNRDLDRIKNYRARSTD